MAQGNDGYISEMDIRIWMRDTDPALNNLIDDLEFSSEEIRTSCTMAVDYFNETAPYVRYYDIATFPFRSALIKATVANLLFMAAHHMRRNSLKYQAGGMTVNDQESYQEYDSAGQRLWDEYKAWVDKTKRAINVEDGWDTIE